MTLRALTFQIVIFIWLIMAVSVDGWDGPIGLGPDTSGVGVLPFEWSGHWGITHSYGFQGWGQDYHDGPVFLDGNFAHWHRRYEFPFSRRPERSGEEAAQSAVWYRRGGYHLDEFALDVRYGQEGGPTNRFQGMKRNFDDRYGLLGPTRLPGAGGTIQQNYRLMMTIPGNSNAEWKFSSAYFKTTDGIPFPSGQGWEKGGIRSDRILANGLSYSRNGLRLDAGGFSQRLKTQNLLEMPDWSADIISYRIGFVLEDSVSPGNRRLLKGRAKYSALASDGLGNQWRLVISGSAGLEKRSRKFRYGVVLGGVGVSPNRWGLLADGDLEYSLNGSDKIRAVVHHSLYPLPFQFTGKSQIWFEEFPPATFNAVMPDSSAISQARAIFRIGLDHRSSRLEAEVGVFNSWANPHYYFENRAFSSPGSGPSYTVQVIDQPIDGTGGVFFEERLNYFRRWWLELGGVSFLENRPGWGNGVQHEATASLSFREFLFNGRLDLGVRLWGSVWGGRRSFVWDPVLGFGYEDYRDVGELYSQDWTGVVNVRFEAVVSTFEVAFNMINLLYTGGNRSEMVTGTGIFTDQFTLAATPFFPPAGRLVFLEFSWRFRD